MPALSALNGLPNLNPAQQQRLVQLARESITSALAGQFDFSATDSNDALKQHGAVFVTLEIAGQLRGCVGSLQAHRSLAQDVWYNAQAAAFHDPRFPPLQREELAQLNLSLSLIGDAILLDTPTESALLAQLDIHQHGVIIEDAGHRATFLPQVWAHFQNAHDFLNALRRKAGLAEQFSATQRYSVYKTLSIKEHTSKIS
jgi:AmmeMemoRadiSam system protein A